MSVRAIALFAFAAALTAANGAPSSVPVCDATYNSQLEAVRRTRLQGVTHLAQAAALLKPVLQAEPGNVRATYTAGLIAMDQADNAAAAGKPALRSDGFAKLVATANGVETLLAAKKPADVACLKAAGALSIMNTLGYYYAKVPDLANTKLYLLKGLAFDQQHLLNPQTQRKTYANLGDLYYTLGDRVAATTYYGKAVQAGDTSPDIARRLTLIKQISAVKL
jgi:hypothetical protein